MNTEVNTLQLTDLLPGDILVLSGGDDWLDRIIMYLTNSQVTHAALAYRDSQTMGCCQIIHETLPVVQFIDRDNAEMMQELRTRTIYVRRTGSKKTKDPVMAQAKRHFDNQEPYPIANLVFVALLLIYKKWAPNDYQTKVMIRFLKYATKKIIATIGKLKDPTKTPMVCSQFVFACYQEAGSDYALSINKGGLLSQPQHSSPLDQALQHPVPLTTAIPEPTSRVNEDLDSLLAELHAALTTATKPILASAQPSIQLSEAIAEFGVAMDFPIANTSRPNGLLSLKQQEPMFVTPADLLSHCDELETIGELHLNNR